MFFAKRYRYMMQDILSGKGKEIYKRGKQAAK